MLLLGIKARIPDNSAHIVFNQLKALPTSHRKNTSVHFFVTAVAEFRDGYHR
jgi:hypothetical protein